jgi:hypothetical protein
MTEAIIPSPLGLLAREAFHGDRELEEILIFTFNHDLGYFERMALSLAHQTGARITVVADAGVAHHDLYAVKRAGTAYLPGLATCSGSFHPKVVVLAGTGDATVAVGSGNLSASGWQGNDELWSIHHANQTSGSPVVTQTAQWLRDLSAVVRVGQGVTSAMERTAARLEGVATGDGPAYLVTTLPQPIIDQLPAGPVDELLLYAPFHDPNGEAIARLIEHFAPEVVRVAIQPKLTRLDPNALERVLRPGDEVVELDNSTYRHGKLIEWSTPQGRWALTGSPNLSQAALLTTTGTGGNVEVGVVAPIAESLFPTGKPFERSKLTSLPKVPPISTQAKGFPLLSAVLEAGCLKLVFGRPLAQESTVEASLAHDSPDHWKTIGAAPAEAIDLVLTTDTITGGARIRLRLPDGVTSSVAFVADPLRLLRRRSSFRSGTRVPDLPSIFSDPAVAEQLWKVIDELKIQGTGAAPSIPKEAGTGKTVTFDVGDWEEYLDRCQGRFGLPLMAFALGLPIPATNHGSVMSIDWDEDVAGDEIGGLDDDTADDEASADQPWDPATFSLTKAQAKERKRFRDAASKLVKNWPDPEPVQRLLALRFALMVAAGHAWDADDHDWAPLILSAVRGLDIDDPDPNYEQAAGSLAALSLSVAESALKRFDPTVLNQDFKKSAAAVSHLLVAADRDLIDEYSRGLHSWLPAYSDPDVVLDMCDRLVAADPLEDAVTHLIGLGIKAAADGGIVDIHPSGTEPLHVAFELLADAEAPSPLLIRTHGDDHTANVIWSRPDLVVIRPAKTPGLLMANSYRYVSQPALINDLRIDGRPNPDRGIGLTPAGTPLPLTVNAALEELGLASLDGLRPVAGIG